MCPALPTALMDDSKKRKRDEELVIDQDTEGVPSKLRKEHPSLDLKTPKAKKMETSKGLADEFTPKGNSLELVVSKTPAETGRNLQTVWNTPNISGSKLLKDSKTPGGTPSNLLKETKTPRGHSAKRKGRSWCSDCVSEPGPGCTEHSRLDLETARRRAEAALRVAQDTLQRLDELVQREAPRLRCTATLKDADGKDREVEHVEVALSSTRLTERERRALCAYLEGLVLEPDWEHLSASSAGCEAIATKCAKLPDRPEGISLKPGAILLLGTSDRPLATCDDSDADAVDSSDEDDANKSWLGDAPPALRIYYGDAVMPHQGRGAKVLGHIKTSLGVFAMAKPRDSSQSEDEESSNGCVVVLSKVTFM